MDETKHKGWYSRGYIPHLDEPFHIQMITFRLFDSLPSQVLQKIESEHPKSNDTARLKTIDAYLDRGKGSCYLSNPEIAALTEDSLLFYDDEKYRILAWVIMPNHVHTLVEIIEGFPLAKIVQSWKSYSASEANKILNRKGRFWQPDYFDRFIRNANHLENAIYYIHFNPVKASLVESPADWPFSSAHYGPTGRFSK